MTSWADQEEEEAQIREKEEELGITETTDENGFKIITEIKKDSQGRRVKVGKAYIKGLPLPIITAR